MEVFEILAHCALPPERCAKVLVSFANYQDRGSAPGQTLILASNIKEISLSLYGGVQKLHGQDFRLLLHFFRLQTLTNGSYLAP